MLFWVEYYHVHKQTIGIVRVIKHRNMIASCIFSNFSKKTVLKWEAEFTATLFNVCLFNVYSMGVKTECVCYSMFDLSSGCIFSRRRFVLNSEVNCGRRKLELKLPPLLKCIVALRCKMQVCSLTAVFSSVTLRADRNGI